MCIRDRIESKRGEILQGDVMKLPFRGETFDVITAFDTIYFWPAISEAFKKVYKILKIGGTFMTVSYTHLDVYKRQQNI